MQLGTRWSARRTSAAAAKEELDNGGIVDCEGPERPWWPRTSGSLKLTLVVCSVRDQHKKKKKKGKKKATWQSPLVCLSIALWNADMRDMPLCGLQAFFFYLCTSVCVSCHHPQWGMRALQSEVNRAVTLPRRHRLHRFPSVLYLDPTPSNAALPCYVRPTVKVPKESKRFHNAGRVRGRAFPPVVHQSTASSESEKTYFFL